MNEISLNISVSTSDEFSISCVPILIEYTFISLLSAEIITSKSTRITESILGIRNNDSKQTENFR